MLPALALALLLPAAPVPKADQQKLRAAFGTVPESDDFSAAFAGGRFTLSTKGKAHRSFYDDGKLVAPRSERAVTGDFTLNATLLATSRPKQTGPKHDARVQSGVYVRGDTETVLFGKFVRAATTDDGKRAVHDESLWVQHDGSGSRIDGCAHDEVVRVRLVKAGPTVTGFVRNDKGEWKSAFAKTTRMADAVTVGVALLSEVDQAVDATFADFKLSAK